MAGGGQPSASLRRWTRRRAPPLFSFPLVPRHLSLSLSRLLSRLFSLPFSLPLARRHLFPPFPFSPFSPLFPFPRVSPSFSFLMSIGAFASFGPSLPLHGLVWLGPRALFPCAIGVAAGWLQPDRFLFEVETNGALDAVLPSLSHTHAHLPSLAQTNTCPLSLPHTMVPSMRSALFHTHSHAHAVVEKRGKGGGVLWWRQTGGRREGEGEEGACTEKNRVVVS